MRDCQGLKKSMPHTAIVSVMDREGDFFELFDDRRINNPDIGLIVRATTGGRRLFETARGAPVMARIEIHIPGQSLRSRKSKQKARPKRTARTAKVTVRSAQVELVQPEHYRDKKPVKIGIIHIREDDPPENTEAIEWFLLTTISLKSVEGILNCIKWFVFAGASKTGTEF